jgi:hypothetical protein
MLLFTEFRAIDKDHYLAEKAQEKFFETQRMGFQGIATQASNDFCFNHFGAYFWNIWTQFRVENHQQSCISCRENLANVTGGTAFAYTLPLSSYPVLPKGYSLNRTSFHVVNAGDNVLSGLTVSIAVAISEDLTDAAPINDPVGVGTLAPHMPALIPKWITPEMGRMAPNYLK